MMVLLIFLVQPFKPAQADAFADDSFKSERRFREWKLNDSFSTVCSEIRAERGLDSFAGLAAARSGYVFAACTCSNFTPITHPGIAL